MKLYYDKKSNDPTYFIQKGIRNGKKTTTKNVFRIGKYSDLIKITDDPLAYAMEQVRLYNEKLNQNKIDDLSLSIDFSEKVPFSHSIESNSTLLNVGYLYLQNIYSMLHLHQFFKSITDDLRIEFDCNAINRFVSFSRILDPGSKLHVFNHLSNFFEKPSFEYQHILRYMDILEKNYDAYLAHLFEYSNSIVERDTSVCFYDCSNFYFETEDEDDDFIDPVTGEVISGFRKYGLSKQHQPLPLVSMGLFMDKQGIPISMNLFPGNQNEQVDVKISEEKMLKTLKSKKVIYCADAGLGSTKIREFNNKANRAFIVTQSIKKLSEPLKQAVFNDCDYHLLSNEGTISLESMKTFDTTKKENEHLYDDFAYKILECESLVDLGLTEIVETDNGTLKKVKSKGKLKQRIIVTYSRKSAEYQKHIRNRQIERAKNILKTKDPEKIKKGLNDVRRFIKSTGKMEYVLDEQKIKEEEKYDGFYGIATNLNDSAKDIFEINSQRYQIEDCFRIMKTNFEGRPVYHHKEARIKAHFMQCYTALLILRLLQAQLRKYKINYTTDKLIETLKAMNVTNCSDVYYQATYTGGEILNGLERIYNLELDKKYYKPAILNKKIKKITK